MLCHWLNAGDFFMIGDNVRFSHIENRSQNGTPIAKFGIQAPATMPIFRREIYERQIAKTGSTRVRALPGVNADRSSMLVLGRYEGEEIYIGESADVAIVVIRIRRDRVRVGIKAPREIPITRLHQALSI